MRSVGKDMLVNSARACVAKQVWQQEGARGMMRGLQATIARAFVMDAVAFAGYNAALRAMADY
jgi:hypothetical protein